MAVVQVLDVRKLPEKHVVDLGEGLEFVLLVLRVKHFLKKRIGDILKEFVKQKFIIKNRHLGNILSLCKRVAPCVTKVILFIS